MLKFFKIITEIQKKLLLSIIEKTKKDKPLKAIRASSNAISILIKAKIPLINKDFTNIDITEANLSHGILSGSNFSNSNLTAVNLTACKMDGCFFINTVIKDAIFTDFYSFELDIQKPIIGVVRNPEKDNANSCCLIVCCKNGNVYEVDLFYPKEKDPKLLKLDYNKEKCSPVPLVANCMAISQKSPKFVIGSRDKDLLFFERNAIESKFDKAIKPLFSRYPPRSISFSNNEKYIIELSETNYIKFWKVDPNTGEFTYNESNSKCLPNFGDLDLNCQTPAYDDSFILIAADNGLLYIWSKPFQKDLTSSYILRDFKSSITSFCSSKNSWKFLCGTRNGEIHSFELKENNGLMEIYMGASANANNEITVLKMMKHETCFLSGDVTGRITLWLFKFSAAMTVIMPLKYFDGHQKSMIVSLELNKYEEYIISSSSDANIIIWKIGDIHELKSLRRHALNYSVTSIDVSDDCSFIVSGGTDGCVILNSGKSKGFLDKIQAHKKMIKCVIISKDKQFLVTAGDDGRIIKWDRSTGKFHKEFGIEGNSTHKESVNEIMQSKNGVFLISGSEDWTVKLWDFDLGSQILILGNNSEIKCLCFSPDCNEILTGDNFGQINIWDFDGSMPKFTIFDNDKKLKVNCLRSFPDNDSKENHEFNYYFASGGDDRKLKIWSSINRKYIHIFDGDYPINIMDISIDGNFLITGDHNLAVKVWDVQYGKKLCLYATFKVYSTATSLKIRKNKIFVGCCDGSVKTFKSEVSNSKFPV